MSKTMALVHFVGEDKTSIIDVNCIPEECRFSGSICQIKWPDSKSKTCSAKVVLISDDLAKLNDAEDQVHQELDEKSKHLPNKRKRRQNTKYKGSASEKDVAIALNEKPPLPKVLKDQKKTISKKTKSVSTAMRSAQRSLDLDVLHVEPVGIMEASGTNSSTLSPEVTKKACSSNSTVGSARRNLLGDIEKNSLSSPSTSRVKESSQEVGSVDPEDENNNDPVLNTPTGIAEATPAACVCSEMKRLCNNQAIKSFWLQVGEMIGINDLPQMSTPKQPEFLELLPTTVNEQLVELSKGSGVFITLRAKNQIKVDFENYPSKMVGALLKVLYGLDALKNNYVTAKGNVAGSKAIKQNVLEAIMGFINRNVTASKKMSWSAFIRAVNRRAGYWREGFGQGSKVAKEQSLVQCTPTKSMWEVTDESKSQAECSKASPHPAQAVNEKAASTSAISSTDVKQSPSQVSAPQQPNVIPKLDQSSPHQNVTHHEAVSTLPSVLSNPASFPNVPFNQADHPNQLPNQNMYYQSHYPYQHYNYPQPAGYSYPPPYPLYQNYPSYQPPNNAYPAHSEALPSVNVSHTDPQSSGQTTNDLIKL